MLASLGHLSQRGRDAVALAGLAALAAGMAAFSWRTWPDPLIDFGREAYVAWQLSQGFVLHRDVVTVSGPLAATSRKFSSNTVAV